MKPISKGMKDPGLEVNLLEDESPMGESCRVSAEILASQLHPPSLLPLVRANTTPQELADRSFEIDKTSHHLHVHVQGAMANAERAFFKIRFREEERRKTWDR